MKKKSNALNKKSILYVLATPIGNPLDITLRALQLLNECDILICEDTRKTGILLKYHKIKKPKLRCPLVSNPEKISRFIQKNLIGKNAVLVSDAGTPGISDPGSSLVRVARESNLDIIPIPGPSAITSLLSVSGFQSNPFIFLGFLPPKGHKRITILEKYIDFSGLIFLFEAVHRIDRLFSEIFTVFGENTEVIIGREITKNYEEYIIISDPKDFEQKLIQKKGEFSLIINNIKKRKKI
jgi:16S rRNA (cytidine1402-2'-O)-methyltransferase